MSRRLSEHERRRRLARHLKDLNLYHQEVDLRVEAALRDALDELRRHQAKQIPEHILALSAEPPDANQTYEQGFIAGFNRCASAMWDALVYSLQRKRAAAKGLNNVERRPKPDVVPLARDYQRRHPEATDRETARHVARRLGLSIESVRHRLRKKTGNS